MTKVKVKDKELYFDGILHKNLEQIKVTIRKDWDYVFVVDGEEGSGKSVLAQQLAYFCSDGNFDVDNICFTPEQFRDAILKAPKYSAVIFDEAFRGLSSRGAMGATNKAIVTMMSEIRQKNLFVFIVLPNVWDLDAYVRLHRLKGLIHVYVDEKRDRGYFRFYSKQKMLLFLADYKNRYKHPSTSTFYGRFTNTYPLDEKAYRKKKHEALGNISEEDDGKKDRNRMYAYELLYLLNKVCHVPYDTIAEKTSISRQTLMNINKYGKGQGLEGTKDLL